MSPTNDCFCISWYPFCRVHDRIDIVGCQYGGNTFTLLLLYILQYVVYLRKDILACECDFAVVYSLLVHAPDTHGFPFEELLPLADDLFRRIPPHQLGAKCDEELQELIEDKK